MTNAVNLASFAAGPAFSYYKNDNQTGLTNSGYTKITFTVSEFDTTNGMYASSRFTPTVAGYYQVTGSVSTNEGNVNSLSLTAIFKNGTQWKQGSTGHGGPGILAVSGVTSLVYLNGSTDYVEIYNTGSNSTGTTHDVIGDRVLTYFCAALVRAA